MNDLHHAPGDRAETVLSRFQQQGRIFHRPQMAQAERAPRLDRCAREIVFAIRTGLAHRLLLEADATRRVAGAAMPKALHEIGTPVPDSVLSRVRLERRVIQKRPIPEHQAPAHAEWPMHLRWLVWLANRGHTVLEVSV